MIKERARQYAPQLLPGVRRSRYQQNVARGRCYLQHKIMVLIIITQMGVVFSKFKALQRAGETWFNHLVTWALSS